LKSRQAEKMATKYAINAACIPWQIILCFSSAVCLAFEAAKRAQKTMQDILLMPVFLL